MTGPLGLHASATGQVAARMAGARKGPAGSHSDWPSAPPVTDEFPGERMTSLPRPTENPVADLHDAAWNAVAAASIAYQEERNRLRYMVDLAHRHGLTIPDLALASGFSEDRVLELLAEVA